MMRSLFRSYMTICVAALLMLREGIVKAQASRNPMLFHRVSVVNVVDGSIRKNAAVLVEGNTIKAVGEYDKLKTGGTTWGFCWPVP